MIVVIGGGLAGCAAALCLARAGEKVYLVERSPHLGGRAGTPGYGTGSDPRSPFGLLDTGQHVFLRCCTAYLQFLKDVGALQHVDIQRRLRVAVYDGRRPGSPPGYLTSSPLPAPFHMAPSVLRYPFLSFRERLGLTRVLRAALTQSLDEPGLWDTTFAAWLEEQGQSRRVIEAFWDLLIVPTLNAPSREVAAAPGLMVLQEALLGGRHAADIGRARVPLSQLLEGVKSLLAARGGRVLTGTFARRVVPVTDGNPHSHGPWGGFWVDVAGGPPLQAKAVIIALHAQDMLRLLPASWAEHPFFRRARGLVDCPIVDLHFFFDRPLVPPSFDFATFLHSEVQWLFHQRTGPEGQHVSVTLSAAHRYASLPNHQLRERFSRELERLFPASGARLLAFASTRQRRATFLPAPGSQEHRLPQRTPLPGLYLAGDWTRSGWPATMEGAVRSGNLAAAALLQDMSSPPSPKGTARSSIA